MFEVKGDRPQWRVIYDRIADMSIGDVIKDDELLGLLPDASEKTVRSAFFRAVREVEGNCKRTFDRVREIGYRMVNANEHEGLARRQHRRAKRRLSDAQRKIGSADRSRLSQDERRRLDAVEMHLNQQADMLRRFEARHDKTDARVARTEKESMEMADRLDRLTNLLGRHGITDAP